MDHGVDFSNKHFIAWAIGIPTLHLCATLGLRVAGLFPERSKKGCRGSDIVAFSIVASLLVTYVTIAGTVGFFNLGNVVDNANNLFVDKFYAQSYYVENFLVYPMFSYQVWNLVCCLILADFRTPDAIGHHIVTGCLGYFGIAPFAQYYALFYFGVAEVSSIPLTLLDIFKFLPDVARKYPALQNSVKATFAVTFFIVRIFVWPFVSYELFFGCVDLFQKGTAHSNFVVGFFLFANMFLTFLQFYWGVLISRKALGGGKSKSKRSQSDKKSA